MKYFILDDDIATRKILRRIIKDDLLGDVIDEADHPVDAELEIIHTHPDIVLIDLLMPQQDGIETVQNLRERFFKGKFIMISQIENKEMVAKAYEEGIEYFIHKPINRVEVTTIIRKVKEQMKMEQTLNKIKEGLEFFQNNEGKKNIASLRNNIDYLLQEILGDLGILGENGSVDLINITKYLLETTQNYSILSENIALKDIYINVLQRRQQMITEKDLKAFEQRIRRAVNQALINLASLGLTDFAHPKFEHYATKFFDFNEIRLKMNELDQKSVKKSARINLRKFIYALYSEMKGRLDPNY